MKKLFLCTFLLISNVIFGADLEVVATIPLPENIRNSFSVSQLYMRRSDCNTKFYFDVVNAGILAKIFFLPESVSSPAGFPACRSRPIIMTFRSRT